VFKKVKDVTVKARFIYILLHINKHPYTITNKYAIQFSSCCVWDFRLPTWNLVCHLIGESCSV